MLWGRGCISMGFLQGETPKHQPLQSRKEIHPVALSHVKIQHSSAVHHNVLPKNKFPNDCVSLLWKHSHCLPCFATCSSKLRFLRTCLSKSVPFFANYKSIYIFFNLPLTSLKENYFSVMLFIGINLLIIRDKQNQVIQKKPQCTAWKIFLQFILA